MVRLQKCMVRFLKLLPFSSPSWILLPRIPDLTDVMGSTSDPRKDSEVGHQPELGDKTWKLRSFSADETVPDSWRVKNADDMVTRVPSLLGYQHIGCEVNLFPHGKVSLSGVSTDDVREGAVLTDILPKIKGGTSSAGEQAPYLATMILRVLFEIFSESLDKK